MNDNGQYSLTIGVLPTILARTHRAFHHRRHDFEMRRVESQAAVNLSTGGFNIGREPGMVFHIAGRLVDLLALEFGKKILRILLPWCSQEYSDARGAPCRSQFPWIRCSPARWIISSTACIRLSPPSSPNRFVPGYFLVKMFFQTFCRTQAFKDMQTLLFC